MDDPIATLIAKIGHLFGIIIELEMRIPSVGITIKNVSRVASNDNSGGNQALSAKMLNNLYILFNELN
jgi:hypothetical protein